MRDIKFRAWDTKGKYLYVPESFFWDGKVTDGVWDGVELVQIQDQVEDGQLHSPHCCVVMQYTGLKDKNGKEIYEGDLVQDPYTGEVGLVKWQFRSLANLSTVLERAMVVGNIYENPELLGKEGSESHV